MGEVSYGRGYVYTIQYHIVWGTKYRHKILQGEVEKSLKKIINQIGEDNQFKIEEMETDLDHVHLLIESKLFYSYCIWEHRKSDKRIYKKSKD